MSDDKEVYGFNHITRESLEEFMYKINAGIRSCAYSDADLVDQEESGEKLLLS